MEKEFLQIITENQGIIHKVCSIYCDLEEDRRDLFQEIIVQLWKSYPSFRSESKFSTWMYRVALNTAITTFKKDKRQPDKSGISYENIQLAEEIYDTGAEEQIKMLSTVFSSNENRINETIFSNKVCSLLNTFTSND